MKKLMSIFICVLLVSIVFFSGCEQKNEGPRIIYNNTTSEDTDGDGWADYEDDFPSDPNYHKLTRIWGPIQFILTPGMQKSQNYNLTSPWGAIIVQWVLTNASYVNYSFASENELHNITFDITIPGASNTTYYDYYNMSNRTLTFLLDYSNMGVWNFKFRHNGGLNSNLGEISLWISILWEQ